jgi:hypothetical protein
MRGGKCAGLDASVSDSFLSKRFFSGKMHNFCVFIGNLFRHVARFFHKSDPVTTISGPNTLQELLVQFDAAPKQKTQHQVQQHYLIREKMMLLEIDFLQEGPAQAFMGLSKVLDEEEGQDAYQIRFVPCVVRPEVLFRGFGKN